MRRQLLAILFCGVSPLALFTGCEAYVDNDGTPADVNVQTPAAPSRVDVEVPAPVTPPSTDVDVNVTPRNNP
jgi:hypothetical protein